MDKYTEWLHTGESENGKLQVWCKIDTIDNEKYLKMQYRDFNGNTVGQSIDYPVKQIKMLNSLIDCYRMEYGYDI